MDRELSGHQFVAGDRFTIGDITALVAIDTGRRLGGHKNSSGARSCDPLARRRVGASKRQSLPVDASEFTIPAADVDAPKAQRAIPAGCPDS